MDLEKKSLDELKDYAKSIGLAVGNIGKDKLIEKIALKEILNQLEPKERQIIILRYFEDKTQSDIAKKMGISQVQVSRIEKKVLLRIRKKMEQM